MGSAEDDPGFESEGAERDFRSGFEVGGGGAITLFDLDGENAPVATEEEIDLRPGAVAVVRQGRLKTHVGETTGELVEDPRFEDRTGESTFSEDLGVTPSAQPSTETGVAEIEFRALGQAFGAVNVVRSEQRDDARSF